MLKCYKWMIVGGHRATSIPNRARRCGMAQATLVVILKGIGAKELV